MYKFTGLITDCFAGGGGASSGIEKATGRNIDIAINHDLEAIRMHQANHTNTLHYCESVEHINPREICNGDNVFLSWFSPDCTHHSKARGKVPVCNKRRGLAWTVIRWASTVKPQIIILENVEEFKDWGPLVEDKNGNLRPCKKRKGETYKIFINAIKKRGYTVETRELIASEYGVPTTRKRLFLVARRDGYPICWPEKTHGEGLLSPVPSSSIIDWSIPGKSIFTRNKPLAENTLRRIEKGINRFVLNGENDFIVRLGQTGWCKDKLSYSINCPLTTITTKNEHCLVSIRDKRGFIMKYNGPNIGFSLDSPLHTITAKHRFALVTLENGEKEEIDILFRMLEPKELFKAQGFREDYIFDVDCNGKKITKAEQVAKCGNSVCPPLAEALVKENIKFYKTSYPGISEVRL